MGLAQDGGSMCSQLFSGPSQAHHIASCLLPPTKTGSFLKVGGLTSFGVPQYHRRVHGKSDEAKINPATANSF